jgi:elongation factor 1-delta
VCFLEVAEIAVESMAEVGYGVWLERGRFEDAERAYQEHLSQLKSGGCLDNAAKSSPCKSSPCTVTPGKSPLACEIARAREHIQKSLGGDGYNPGAADCSVLARVTALEKENRELRTVTEELRSIVTKLTSRLAALEIGSGVSQSAVNTSQPATQTPAAKEEPAEPAGADDDFELFGSDEEEANDAEADRVREERLKAYEAKKSKKPVLVAKSNIILDVKPWDDETDMAKLEQCVRSIEMDGLLWGASKLVPLAYGIKKLQISCVVEDDKVSTDDLEERLVAFEDYIQSMDIAAFNKI